MATRNLIGCDGRVRGVALRLGALKLESGDEQLQGGKSDGCEKGCARHEHLLLVGRPW